MSDPVIYQKDSQGIVTLTLNRPETRNPLTDADMLEAILASLARLCSVLRCRSTRACASRAARWTTP